MEPQARDIQLRDYWSTIVRRRWTVVFAIVSVALVALVGGYVATPLYRGTVTLQIERSNPEILTFRELSQVDYAWAAYNDYYQTQYKIIGSQPVALRTVDRLGLVDHPQMQPARPGLLARALSLIPRRVAPGPTAVATDSADPRAAAAARLQARLQVTPVRNSQLVRISWTSPSPELAAEVANGVASAYIQLNMESKYSVSGQAEEFLVNQIVTLKREITELELRLQEYGESKSIVSIDDSNNITLQALKDISERRTEAETNLATAEATYRSLVDADPDGLPAVMTSSLITQLRHEYATLEAELTEKSRQFGTEWPGVVTLRSRLDQAETRLQSETGRIVGQVRAAARAGYLSALNEVRNLEQLVDDRESAAQRLKRDAVEFANLRSEVDKKRETLDALITRQNEMALSTRLQDLDVTSSNIRIVERAQAPTAPFRPDVRLNLAVGLVLGLLLGLGLVLTLEHLDNTIGSLDELQRISGLPVLAVIPRHGDNGSALLRARRRSTRPETVPVDLVAHRDARAAVSEAYRDLRTAILLSSPGHPPRKILVTSSLPEDGKTATSINLAVVLAQLGSRVLLVDTDLRRPRLHQAFNASNRKGMSNCLSGLEDDATRLVLPTGIDGLDLLPSGPVPPNPSELLNSPTFARLTESLLESGYDHVVFDSPPLLAVSDPVIIASAVDSCVLVVRAGRTPRQAVRVAVDKLRQAGDVPRGAVLNDVDLETHGRAEYGYGAYSRYAEDDDDQQPPQRAVQGGGSA